MGRPERYFRDKNCMTPFIIEYGFIKEHHGPYPAVAYELSWGSGILTNKLFGVTISTNQSHHVPDSRSGVFYTEQDARNYIQKLKTGANNEM